MRASSDNDEGPDREVGAVKANRYPPAFLFLFGVVLAALALAGTGCGSSKPVIRVHAWETGSHFLNNAIFEFIVEEGYGYPVETVVETTPVLKEAMPRGDVDLNLEGWQHNVKAWYEEEIRNGNIVNLGMNFEGGPQFFIIPRRVAEEHGIKTVLDMKDHWELFQDPQDPSKGVFYNCLVGWECAEINAVKLEAYGLSQFSNAVSPGSGTALENALATSQERGQPVFGYYWAPTSLMGSYEWHILEEPEYSDECWDRIAAATGDASLRPVEQACAYQNPAIDKIAHAGLKRKAPAVVEMLERMVVGLGPLNETLAWADENDVEDWRSAAIHYLQRYEDRWSDWVTPKAHDRIKKALASAGLPMG